MLSSYQCLLCSQRFAILNYFASPSPQIPSPGNTSPNSIAWSYTFLGIIAAGLRATFANTAYTPPELTHQLKDSRAHLIFAHPLLFPTILKTLQGLGLSEEQIKSRVIIMSHTSQDEKDEMTVGIPAGWTRLKQWRSGEKLAKEEEFTGSQVHETALLCYSSGTTGLAKGVEVRFMFFTIIFFLADLGFYPLRQPMRTLPRSYRCPSQSSLP